RFRVTTASVDGRAVRFVGLDENRSVTADCASIHRGGGHAKPRYRPGSGEVVPQGAGVAEDLHGPDSRGRKGFIEKQDGDVLHSGPLETFLAYSPMYNGICATCFQAAKS